MTNVKEVVGEDGKVKYQAEIAVKFFTDKYGKKWMMWGDKNEVEMALWVEEMRKQAEQAELKAKLLIVGSVAAALVGSYVTYKIGKRLIKWNHNRKNVSRWEAERKSEAREQADMCIVYDLPAIVIVGIPDPRYIIEGVPVA